MALLQGSLLKGVEDVVGVPKRLFVSSKTRHGDGPSTGPSTSLNRPLKELQKAVRGRWGSWSS